jgi:hypothetical protein
MQDRSAGHPLGALLIIVAIFSVALAFSVATPPAPAMAVNVAVAVTSHPAAVPERAPEAPAPVVLVAGDRGAGPSLSAEAHRATVVVAADKKPAMPEAPKAPAGADVQPPGALIIDAAQAPAASAPLAAFSWSTMQSRYPMTAARVGVDEPATAHGPGAVTGALASAGSAVRSAFRKAF